MQIILDNLTEKGKFGILSLLFKETREKERNSLIEPFSSAAFSLTETNDTGKVYINFGIELKKELSTLIDLNFITYSGSLTVIFLILLNILKFPPCLEVIEWFIV